MTIKPTGGKNYGSIAHLLNSRMGPADHACHEGMQRIATEVPRNRHDRVIVQEKLDGTNVGVAKVDNEIIALQRAGYPAATSPFIQHRYFARWVDSQSSRFDQLLSEGERVCGEWLMQAHGTRYRIQGEPFVPFDIMRGTTRCIYEEFVARVSRVDFQVPFCIHQGAPLSIQDAMDLLGEYGKHGAIDPVEGAVWRVETNRLKQPGKSSDRQWVVDFVVKYVRPSKKDGIYLPDISGEPIVWNVQPELLNLS